MYIEDAVEWLKPRFYQWALADFDREIRQDFPFLRRIRSEYLQFRILPAIESLSIEDRTRLASALVKQRHPHFTTAKPLNPLTPEDNHWIEWYRNMLRWPSQEELDLRSRRFGGKDFQIKRRELKRLLNDYLTPILGEPVKMTDADRLSGEWKYRTSIGEWTILTWFDIGAPHCQLRYAHIAIPPEGLKHHPKYQHLPIGIMLISFLTWLGLHGETSWDLLTKDDIPEAASLATELCAHFIQAARGLLEDFDPKQIPSIMD
jgi:hypothetical protein